MTLAQAIVVIGNDSAPPAVRARAAEQTLKYLKQVVARNGGRDQLQEAAQVVICRLYTNRRAPLDNPTEAAAKRYLRTALFFESYPDKEPVQTITTDEGELELRVDDDPLTLLIAEADTLKDEARLEAEAAAVDAARTWLVDVAIPAAAAPRRYPDRVLARLDELRQIAAGRTTVQELVAEESPNEGPDALRRARATRNQHHTRARQMVNDHLDDLPDSERLRIARALFDALYRSRRKST